MNHQLRSTWERWREQLWSTFVRLESVSDSDNFYGEVAWATSDCNRLATVKSTTQLTERTPTHIRSDPNELVLLAIQRSGHGFIEQSGRQSRLEAGDFGLYETTRPYRLSFDSPFEQLIFKLPLNDLARRLPGLSRLTGLNFQGRVGAGAVATAFAQNLASCSPSLGLEGLSSFDSAAVDMVATAIELQTRGGDPRDRLQWERIQARLTSRLRDPEIDLDEVASAEGMSLRGLQRLFQLHGVTPTRWLQERRLEGVARDLRAQKCGSRTISEIAYSWGFNDLSNFNRVFRAKFGRSPRAFRQG